MEFVEKEYYSIENLLGIVHVLRSPKGCPWDRKQTHKSIRKNFIEETYEAVEAIDTNNSALLKEELGDVLLQVLLHSQMEKETGAFSFKDVVDGLAQKLVFRHPHVFGAETAKSSQDALNVWEAQKKIEKAQTTTSQSLVQVSKALPALMYSQKVQERASKAGFDYTHVQEALEHLGSEIKELQEAIKEKEPTHIHEELGDVLFSVVNVSRFLNIESEEALSDSTTKFISRFTIVEQLATKGGIDLKKADLETLNSLWAKAKDIHLNFGGNLE